MAVLRVPAAGPCGPRHALAPGLRESRRRGPGQAPGRGTAERHPAGRGQERRRLVGLVRDKDRRRVAAQHRPCHLCAPGRLAAGIRPAPTGAAPRTPGPRPPPSPRPYPPPPPGPPPPRPPPPPP